jgi:tetratricopeptide (TPR) repeat protein
MRKIKLFTVACLAIVSFSVLGLGASAKDEWIEVRSKNFFLIGNAPERDIKKVATKLEQFRETFRLLFRGMSLTSSVPTNVVVFKSNSAYKPFKPRRADGKADDFIAGYFQHGEDVNYITLSTEGAETDFSTIFHEYVHFIVDTNFGKSNVPTWFNEGLAEYYSTFQIENDQDIKLGLPEKNHLYLLQQNKLMPLATLFNVGNRALHQTGGHSRTIFYAESWALIHYLIQGGKLDGLGKFLDALIKDVPVEKAFQDSFQISYAAMEKELRQYVGKSSFQYVQFSTKNKLTFDAQMQVSPLDDADSNAYLGDLLYHTNRGDDAEPFLRSALTSKPDSIMANTALAMIKLRQRKYEEAKTYLDKAVTLDPKNYMALYQYAYLLSREAQDEFGYVNKFSPEKVLKMRELLKRAIAANPSYTESYEFLAFVNLVSGEELDESIKLLNAALKYQPGNQKYALRIADIYARQQKFGEARKIAEKIAATSDDDEIRARAENLAAIMKQNEESFARYEEAKKQTQSGSYSQSTDGPPVLLRTSEKELTPEQLEKLQQKAMLRSINANLRRPAPNERRELGNILKIDCRGGKIFYSVKTATDTFNLTSKDFQQLELNAFIPMGGDAQVGCNASLASVLAVLTFKPAADAKSPDRGELVAIDFVPAGFRLMETPSSEEAAVSDQTSSPAPQAKDEGAIEVITAGSQPPPDLDSQRREMMMNSIREQLRKPGTGETREFGFVEKSECNTKGAFFFIKTASGQLLKLSLDQNKQPQMGVYTREMENVQVGCGMKALDIPVVVVFKTTADSKSKTNGELISMEFVPKSFELEK